MTNERTSLVEGPLFTDQYQLTMAQVYFRNGIHDRPARFDYAFRSYPDYGRHQAGYCVFAGISDLVEWMQRVRFGPAELDALRTQRTAAGDPVFDGAFLDWLGSSAGWASVDVKAVAEGRIVHPYAPIVTVEGPLAVAQLLETSLLNHLNYPTLVATKASRVAESARGGTVLEFGTRRGPGFGANVGARAALIGGADFTSNVGMSHHVGLQPKGTHGHSMVQAFMALGLGELGAFRAYADVYPDDCVLLVDTVDTLGSGVPNAIVVFEELRRRGHAPVGVRLDSGDLAYLAIQTARLLDEAGFTDVGIVLSSNLDELAIWQILAQIEEEAPRYGVDPARLTTRLVYGVGTRLITSHGHAALDGVYKLVAIEERGAWVPAIKISENRQKVPIPGEKRLWRVLDARGYATADVVALAGEAPGTEGDLRLHHPYRSGIGRTIAAADITRVQELLQPAFADGAAQVDGDIGAARQRREADLERLDPGVRRLVNPHIYHVSMTAALKRLQDDLIAEYQLD